MKGRIQAFTILEVTIAMLLAALTIGIGYTAYSLVGRSYRSFDNKNKKVSEFVLLSKLLSRDILGARSMTRIQDGISLESNAFSEDEGDDASKAITYRFFPAYVLRDQYDMETDTFFVASHTLLSSFEDKETAEGELTDKISFRAVLEGAETPMVFTKVYSAEELFR